MNIRNHGIDTVKITFANNKNGKGKAFNPNDLRSLNVRLLSLSKQKNPKWTSISNRLNIVDSGFTDTFSFQSNKGFSSIYISLPKLIYGNNVDGLELNKSNIKDCINKLSDIIEFDAGKGRIQRLDYCFNFNTDESWYPLLCSITCKNKYYSKVVYNDSTLYFQNNSQQLCFYRQDDGRYNKANHKKELSKIEKIKNELRKIGKSADCLFRVESRLQRDILKNIKMDTSTGANKYSSLLFEDLKQDYYSYLIFQKIKKLIKVPIYSDNYGKSTLNGQTIDLSNIRNTDDFSIQVLAYYISVRGMANVINEFQSIQFDTQYHHDNVWDRVVKAESMLLSTTKHNSSAKIKEHILGEIDIMFPQKSAPLF